MVKRLPHKTHLALDAAGAPGLSLLPWVLGRKNPVDRRVPAAIGIYELSAVAFSDPSGGGGLIRGSRHRAVTVEKPEADVRALLEDPPRCPASLPGASGPGSSSCVRRLAVAGTEIHAEAKPADLRRAKQLLEAGEIASAEGAPAGRSVPSAPLCRLSTPAHEGDHVGRAQPGHVRGDARPPWPTPATRSSRSRRPPYAAPTCISTTAMSRRCSGATSSATNSSGRSWRPAPRRATSSRSATTLLLGRLRHRLLRRRAVGLFAIASAYLLGAERVTAIDRFPERLRLARERAGASEVLDCTQVDVVEELKALTGGRGPDSCIDAIGMEAHSGGLEGAYDRVKQATRLESSART